MPKFSYFLTRAGVELFTQFTENHSKFIIPHNKLETLISDSANPLFFFSKKIVASPKEIVAKTHIFPLKKKRIFLFFHLTDLFPYIAQEWALVEGGAVAVSVERYGNTLPACLPSAFYAVNL